MATKPSTIVVVEDGSDGKIFRSGDKNFQKLSGYFNLAFGVFISRPALGKDFTPSMIDPEAQNALLHSAELKPEWFELGDQLRIPVEAEVFEIVQSR